MLTIVSKYILVKSSTYKSINLLFIIEISNSKSVALAKGKELGRMDIGSWYYRYFEDKWNACNLLELNALFITSAIGSAIKLKLLHENFPLKFDLIDIKARVSKVIIVFKAEENFRINLLKALSTSNF